MGDELERVDKGEIESVSMEEIEAEGATALAQTDWQFPEPAASSGVVRLRACR